MKKILALFVSVLMIFAFAGCKKQNNANDVNTEKSPQSVNIEFEAQYIRTNYTGDNQNFPRAVVINSLKELKEYYESNKDNYYLERQDWPENYVDVTIGFLDACDKFNEDFFNEKSLVFALTEEPSGSISHEVKNVVWEEEKLNINIERRIPYFGNDAMGYWHIIIEVDKEYIPQSSENIIIETTELHERLVPENE